MKCIGLAAVVFACALSATGVVQAATIYQEEFDGAPGVDLHGTTPAVGAAAWSAHTAFDEDGIVTPVASGSGAFLPFTPAAGKIYTLSASLRSVVGATNNFNWLAMGYLESVPANSQQTGNNSRFVGSNAAGSGVGKAWMLFRGNNNAGNPNQSFRGSADSGTVGTIPWVGGIENGGDVDLQIVLNTLGGPGTIKATFLAKRPADATYTDIGGGALALNAEDIGAVGLAFSNTGVAGSIGSFSLTAIPEPGAGLLAAMAAAAAALRGQRRRRRFAAPAGRLVVVR